MNTEKFREIYGNKELYVDGWLAALALNDRPQFEAICAQNHGRLVADGVGIDFSLQEYIDYMTYMLLYEMVTLDERRRLAEDDVKSFEERRKLIIDAQIRLSKNRKGILTKLQGKIDFVRASGSNSLSKAIRINTLFQDFLWKRGGFIDVHLGIYQPETSKVDKSSSPKKGTVLVFKKTEK